MVKSSTPRFVVLVFMEVECGAVILTICKDCCMAYNYSEKLGLPYAIIV